MTTIIRPKDHAEWLQHRSFGIGSSEVATIVGLNPWESKYQLWRRKKGLDPAKEETFAMKAGHYLEDAVSRFWEDETGNHVIKSSAGDWIAVDTQSPWLRVSPDRTYFLGRKRLTCNKGILECKTTQMSIDPDDVPKHWFCQLQYQMGVMGMQHGALAWLCAGREFGYKEYAFKPQFFEWLRAEVDEFWQKNIVNGEEPEPVSVADVLLKFGRHTDGKEVEATPEAYSELCRLKGIKQHIKELEEQQQDCEQKIKLLMLDAERLTAQGQTLATWKAGKDTQKFDKKKFETEHPQLAQMYTVSQPGARRFVIK